MSDMAIAFGLGYILVGLLCVALAIPLIRGRVRPNRWCGIRIPAAFESDEAWYRINRHGGTSVLYYGIALIIAGIVNSLFLPARPSHLLFRAVAYGPLVLLVPMLIHIYRYPRH